MYYYTLPKGYSNWVRLCVCVGHKLVGQLKQTLHPCIAILHDHYHFDLERSRSK